MEAKKLQESMSKEIRQDLFNHLVNEHDLTLLESELDFIIMIVGESFSPTNRAIPSEEEIMKEAERIYPLKGVESDMFRKGDQGIWCNGARYVLSQLDSNKPEEGKICNCECPTGRTVDENWNQICDTCGNPTIRISPEPPK